MFQREWNLFKRETENGMYRPWIYFVSKQIADVPIFIAIPVIFSSIIYFMIDLHHGFDHFLVFTFVLILDVQVAVSFGKPRFKF